MIRDPKHLGWPGAASWANIVADGSGERLVHILYLAANGKGQVPLELEQEIYDIQRRVSRASRSRKVRFSVYPKLDLSDLQTILEDAEADILHLAGHADTGSFELSAARSGDEEAVVRLSANELADYFNALRLRYRLVVLNGCKTAAMKALLRCADFVIGNQAEVSNLAASKMAAALYEGLARGCTLDDAFASAKVLLRTFGSGRGDPVLLARTGMIAKETRLSEPFRMVARFPSLDEAAEEGRPNPPKLVDDGSVDYELGVGGAPTTATQLVVFTDDSSFLTKSGPVETDLCAVIRETPAGSEMWVGEEYSVTGDSRWFATVVTPDGYVESCVSGAREALDRYYFEERWMPHLPVSFEVEIRKALNFLKDGDGTRRRSATGHKATRQPKGKKSE